MNCVIVHGSVRNLYERRFDRRCGIAEPALPQPQRREHDIRLAGPIHSQPVDEGHRLLEAGLGRDVGEHRHFGGIPGAFGLAAPRGRAPPRGRRFDSTRTSAACRACSAGGPYRSCVQERAHSPLYSSATRVSTAGHCTASPSWSGGRDAPAAARLVPDVGHRRQRDADRPRQPELDDVAIVGVQVDAGAARDPARQRRRWRCSARAIRGRRSRATRKRAPT